MKDLKEHLYRGKERLGKLLEKVEKLEISDVDKKHIKKYADERIANGGDPYTIYVDLDRLIRTLLLFENDDYTKITKDDIVMALSKVEIKPTLSLTTKSHIRAILKSFLKHIGVKDADFIKTRRRYISRIKNHGDLLTGDERIKMVSVAPNSRDKLILQMCFELGCRPSELLSLRIKDVVIEGERTLVNLQISKTDTRTIPIVNSTPYWIDWMKVHPQKDNPEAPLFPPFGKTDSVYPIKPGSLREVIQRIAKRAGVTKRAYSYLLRHCSVTDYYEMLPSKTLTYKYGWRDGSSMPDRIYSHLSVEKHFNIIDKCYGIQPAESKKILLTIKKCLFCNREYGETHDYCDACKMPLDKEKIKQILDKNQKREVLTNKLDELLLDSEFSKFLENKKRERKQQEGETQ